MERSLSAGLEELWRLRTANDKDQPAKQLITLLTPVHAACNFTGLLGNISKLVNNDNPEVKLKKTMIKG